MKRLEHESRSIGRLTAFLAGLTCIALLIVGRLWLIGGQYRNEIAAECALDSLVLEGHELHESLRTRQPDSIRDLPIGVVAPGNPHLSTEEEFVEAIARGGSQGRLGREGIRSALYARYAAGESEVGCYGLEAKSDADADQREKALRGIWAYNARLNRAYIHRKDLVIVVVWHDGVSPECWESVNATVVKQLNASGTL